MEDEKTEARKEQKRTWKEIGRSEGGRENEDRKGREPHGKEDKGGRVHKLVT